MTNYTDLMIRSALQEDEAEARKAQSIEGEKQDLLKNPSLIDKAVANIADYYSPTASTKKPKGESYGVDTVEASKDPGDPTVGLGHRLRDEYTNSLAMPEYKGVPAGQLLHGIAKKMMVEPGEDGKSRLEKTYEFSKLEDSRIFGSGVKNKKMPGYDDWLADRKLQEKQSLEKESWLPNAEDMAIDTGMGALFGGAAGFVGGGLSGAATGAGLGAATGMAIGGPVGAGVGTVFGGIGGFFGGAKIGVGAGATLGAAVGLGGSIVAAPIKKFVHGTDWYQGMIGSNAWQDNAKAMLADVLAYIPGSLVGGKAYQAAGNKAFGKLGISGIDAGTDTGSPFTRRDAKGLFEGTGGDGKPPGGPGIDLSGEGNLSSPPPGQIEFKPGAERTSSGGRLYTADGRLSPQPDTGMGEGATPVRPTAPPTEPAVVGEQGLLPGGIGKQPLEVEYTPESIKLIGGGKGYEWPGAKNLGRGEKTAPFDIPEAEVVIDSSRPLLEDLRGKDLAEMDLFAAKASGKVYSDLVVPEGKSPVMTEDALLDAWKVMAEKGQRPFNPYADMKAAENVEKSTFAVMKAKASVAENPSAANIMQEVKKKPAAIEKVPESTIVDDVQELSPVGLKEVGLDPIDPVVDVGVKKLEGEFGTKVLKAKDNDFFVKIAEEDVDGPTRTAIAKNLEEEIKPKMEAVPVDDTNPVVEEFTKIDPEVVVTPKDQERAVTNVNSFVDAGDSVIDEVFPKKSLDELKRDYFMEEFEVGTPEERAALAREEAIMEVGKGAGEGKILDTIKSILDDDTPLFKQWMERKGIEKPSEVMGKDFSIYSTIEQPGVKLGADINAAKSKYYESLGVTTDAERKAQIEGEVLANLEAKRAGMKSDFMKNKPIGKDELKVAYKAALANENSNLTRWANQNGFALPEDKMRKYKLMTGVAAFGLIAPVMYDKFSDTKADASVLSSVLSSVKTSSSAATKTSGLILEAMKKGLLSRGVTTETVMGGTHFQTGLKTNAKELFTLVNANIRAGKGAGAQYSLMSPYQSIEALFRTGGGKTINAAVNLASFVVAGTRTKDNAIRVVKNILDEGGITIAANKVKSATAPLVPLAAKAAKADAWGGKLKLAEGRLATLMENKNVKDAVEHAAKIKVEQDTIAQARTEIQKLSGSVKTYHTAWTEVMQKLAGEHSSVRISLALEDPKRTLYPWLPRLNRTEEIAVGKLRGMLDQYQVRLKERKIPTRDNYFPHSPHPDMAKIFSQELSDVYGGAPYQKFYRRTSNSRPLLPDAHYSMRHYLADIEPRIQNHDFWKVSGWRKVMDSPIIQSNPGLKRAFDQLYEGTKGAEQTWGNVAATRYAEFEAVNKLFLSPSAGLKHLVKATADLASVGMKVWGKSFPEVAGHIARTELNRTYGINQVSIRDKLAKLGVKSVRFERQLLDDVMDSAIMSGNIRKYMLDMGIESQDQVFTTAKTLWNKTQDVGSAWINLAELFDRSISVSSGLQMAAKKGMTAEQAIYGIHDLILKNNFLYGQFNPTWLNNPKIRALFMFQATPFKIFERRLVNAQRSIANVKQLSSEVQKVLREPGGFERVKNDVINLRKYMREGQSELKSNLIADTIMQETDFYGTSIVKQLVTDMLTVGAFTYGGAQAGLALSDHFFHIPFLSTQSEGGKAELALSPIVSETMKGYNAWKNREDSEDFVLTDHVQRWIGRYGPLPKTLEKAVRLNDDDIPDIYKKGGGSGYLKYLFGVPGKD